VVKKVKAQSLHKVGTKEAQKRHKRFLGKRAKILCQIPAQNCTKLHKNCTETAQNLHKKIHRKAQNKHKISTKNIINGE
jgi:hypothetical protein